MNHGTETGSDADHDWSRAKRLNSRPTAVVGVTRARKRPLRKYSLIARKATHWSRHFLRTSIACIVNRASSTNASNTNASRQSPPYGNSIAARAPRITASAAPAYAPLFRYFSIVW